MTCQRFLLCHRRKDFQSLPQLPNNVSYRDLLDSGIRGVELNARYFFVLTVVMFDEGPWEYIDSANFGCFSSFFASQHLKIVLENIDQLVGLESSLHSESNAVDKLLQLLVDVLLLLRKLLHLADEVVRVVLNDGINHAIKVGLRLKPLYNIL